MTPGSLALLTTGLGRGGAETQLVRVALGMRDRGWRVSVTSLLRPGPMAEPLERGGVPVASSLLPSVRPLAIARAALGLRRVRPDVLCAFMYHATLAATAAAPFVGRPAVVSSMRSPAFGRRGRDDVVASLARSQRIDAVVSNSQLAARGLDRKLPESMLHVIGNGLDFDEWSPDGSAAHRVRASLGAEPGERLFLAVGNWRWEKDYPTLLEAFRRLRGAEERPSRLLIAGRGEPDERSARLLAQLGASVVVLGARDDVRDLMRAADVFVLSSCSEGLPNVVLEAAATGTPVVATDVGGVREIVDASGSHVVPPEDPEQLAAAMAKTLSAADDQLQRMGTAARERARARFELEQVLDTWDALFRELASRVGDALPAATAWSRR